MPDVDALVELAEAFRQEGALEEAGALALVNAQQFPNYSRVWFCLGVVQAERRQHVAAEHSFREALRLSPGLMQAANNLGNTLLQQCRADEAIGLLARALHGSQSLDRHHRGLIHKNIALALKQLGQPQRALEHARQYLADQPDNPTAPMHLGVILLTLGQLSEGWRHYRVRRLQPEPWGRPLPGVPWYGQPVAGIVLYPEQGLGDCLHFIRAARRLKERGTSVAFLGLKRLHPLLRDCPYIDQLLCEGEEPEFPWDAHASVLEACAVLTPTLDSIDGRVPYLRADPQRVAQWGAKLKAVASGAKPRWVGVCWQGEKANAEDPYRSVHLSRFAPLAQIEGVRLLSLQVGAGVEQLRAVPFDVMDFGDALDADGAFVDSAALIANLDLVVTVDSALAHLAGALGCPVWVALFAGADWRWLHNRQDSPWYPTMRLFRQPALGEWRPVFAAIASELKALACELHEPPGPRAQSQRPLSTSPTPGLAGLDQVRAPDSSGPALHLKARSGAREVSALLGAGRPERAALLARAALRERPFDGRLRGLLWHARKAMGQAAPFASQSGQDECVWQLLGQPPQAVYADVGAYDGVMGSNTLFFERQQWQGVCFEPSPVAFSRLRGARTCPCYQVAIGARQRRAELFEVRGGYTQMSCLTEHLSGELEQRLRQHPAHEAKGVMVDVLPLGEALRQAGLSRVDYLSIDVEGCELEVLECFDLSTWGVRVLSVEDNGAEGLERAAALDRPLPRLMRTRGFRAVARLGVDWIFALSGQDARP